MRIICYRWRWKRCKQIDKNILSHRLWIDLCLANHCSRTIRSLHSFAFGEARNVSARRKWKYRRHSRATQNALNGWRARARAIAIACDRNNLYPILPIDSCYWHPNSLCACQILGRPLRVLRSTTPENVRRIALHKHSVSFRVYKMYTINGGVRANGN